MNQAMGCLQNYATGPAIWRTSLQIVAHEMLRHGMVMYDALYAWCKQGQAETHYWPGVVVLAAWQHFFRRTHCTKHAK